MQNSLYRMNFEIQSQRRILKRGFGGEEMVLVTEIEVKMQEKVMRGIFPLGVTELRMENKRMKGTRMGVTEIRTRMMWRKMIGTEM